MKRLERMWINQPSTLQPDHRLHGVNVLADMETEDDITDVYLLEGNIVSTRIFKSALSKGWRTK